MPNLEDLIEDALEITIGGYHYLLNIHKPVKESNRSQEIAIALGVGISLLVVLIIACGAIVCLCVKKNNQSIAAAATAL